MSNISSTVEGSVDDPAAGVGDTLKYAAIRKRFNHAIFELKYFFAAPTRSIGRLFRTALFVEIVDIFGRASENYALWSVVGDTVSDSYPGQAHIMKTRYRKLVVEEAHWYYKHDQIVAKASALAILASVLAFAGIWTFLVTAVPNSQSFIVTSLVLFAIAAVFTLYYTVRFFVNLKRVIVVGIISLVLGIVASTRAAGGRWLEADNTTAHAGLALTVFGAFCVVTAFAGAASERSAIAQWEKTSSAALAVILSAQVIADLKKQDMGFVGDDMQYTRWRLSIIAKSVEFGLPGTSLHIFSQRAQAAASVVRDCSVWLLLQQLGTNHEIQKQIRGLAFALLSGYYHDLPTRTGWRPHTVPKLPRRTKAMRISRHVLSGVLPAAVVFSLPLTGVNLPDTVRQWAAAVAAIWLLTKLILAIDPDFRTTWKEVRGILSSRESFAEQRKTKAD